MTNIEFKIGNKLLCRNNISGYNIKKGNCYNIVEMCYDIPYGYYYRISYGIDDKHQYPILTDDVLNYYFDVKKSQRINKLIKINNYHE